MVRVQVGEEDVRLVHIYAELGKAGGQGLAALGHAKARVYDEGTLAVLDNVGVEAFERVPRQRHGYGINIVFDVGIHVSVSISF